jgi:DNA-binding transcriptional regulator YiaG
MKKLKDPTWKDRINKLVESLGSPEKLAARLDVSYWTILRWRNGDHQPSRLAKKEVSRLEEELRSA